MNHNELVKVYPVISNLEDIRINGDDCSEVRKGVFAKHIGVHATTYSHWIRALKTNDMDMSMLKNTVVDIAKILRIPEEELLRMKKVKQPELPFTCRCNDCKNFEYMVKPKQEPKSAEEVWVIIIGSVVGGISKIIGPFKDSDTAEIWGTAHANEFQWYARKVSSPEANSENITFETEYVCD